MDHAIRCNSCDVVAIQFRKPQTSVQARRDARSSPILRRGRVKRARSRHPNSPGRSPACCPYVAVRTECDCIKLAIIVTRWRVRKRIFRDQSIRGYFSNFIRFREPDIAVRPLRDIAGAGCRGNRVLSNDTTYGYFADRASPPCKPKIAIGTSRNMLRCVRNRVFSDGTSWRDFPDFIASGFGKPQIAVRPLCDSIRPRTFGR